MAHKHESQNPIERIDTDRNRYNAAFDALGLEWHWDEKTYAELQSSLEKNPVHVYVETRLPHLLRAYDSDFLVKAVETKRSQLVAPMHA